jgi:hypothetical protein
MKEIDNIICLWTSYLRANLVQGIAPRTGRGESINAKRVAVRGRLLELDGLGAPPGFGGDALGAGKATVSLELARIKKRPEVGVATGSAIRIAIGRLEQTSRQNHNV